MYTVNLDARYFGTLKTFAARARVPVSPFRGNNNNESFFTQTVVSSSYLWGLSCCPGAREARVDCRLLLRMVKAGTQEHIGEHAQPMGITIFTEAARCGCNSVTTL